MGWLYDADHALHRITRGTTGMQNVLGAKEPISRYKNVNTMGKRS